MALPSAHFADRPWLSGPNSWVKQRLDKSSTVISATIDLEAIITDQTKLAVMLHEIPYCMERTLLVLGRLVDTHDDASMFTYGSCIVYLTGFCARMAHENPGWFNQPMGKKTVGECIVEVVQSNAKLWRANVPLRAAIDIAEGSKGIDTIPGINNTSAMLNKVMECPDMLEWTNRFANETKQSRWAELTLAVTLQWCITKTPNDLLKYIVNEVRISSFSLSPSLHLSHPFIIFNCNGCVSLFIISIHAGCY